MVEEVVSWPAKMKVLLGVGGLFGRGRVLEFFFVRVEGEGHDGAVA
jgi:hypothetical protein